MTLTTINDVVFGGQTSPPIYAWVTELLELMCRFWENSKVSISLWDLHFDLEKMCTKNPTQYRNIIILLFLGAYYAKDWGLGSNKPNISQSWKCWDHPTSQLSLSRAEGTKGAWIDEKIAWQEIMFHGLLYFVSSQFRWV